MPTERKSSGNEIYQIKVTLLRTAPPIWRRLLIPSDITLADLHDLLQLAIGWTDSHLHEFLFHGKRYGSTDPDVGVTEAIDERKVRESLFRRSCRQISQGAWALRSTLHGNLTR